MQLKLSFTALLAGVLIALSAPNVDAKPVTKRNAGISLPLKRMQARSDVHPLIYIQQHVNRGERRLARMTGREAPSDLELRERLQKRVAQIEDGTLSKRYNRSGLPKSDRLAKRYNRTGVPNQPRGLGDVVNSIFGGHKHHKGGNGNGNGNAGGAASGGAGDANGSGDSSTDTGSGASGTDTSSGAAATDSVPIPSGVTVSNDPSTADSVALDIEAQDVGYLATVQIGTPPRDFLILMDSGSSDFWVGAENCQSQDQSQQGCGNHNFLGSQSSSTFTDTGKQFSVTYGTGNVAGDVIQDQVTLAGLSLGSHTFGVATSESVDFSSDDTPFDGLMGLAQSTLSNEGVLTPPEALVQLGLIQEAIVSYKIPRLADNLEDGEVTFGSLDQSKFDPNTLTTVDNVNQQGFFEAAVDSFSVDGQDAGLQGRTAILDTGTTLIIAPPDDAAAIHQLIQGSSSDGQTFTIPCTTQASVALTIGGTTFAIDTRDLIVQPVDANNPNGDCVSGIQSGTIGSGDQANTEWLVGDVFLKNAYYSTNVEQNTVSLAKLV